jgi:hypothetical protein
MIVFGGWHCGADGVPEYQRDTRHLDLHTLTWTRPRVNGDSPGERYSHCAACVGNVMVITGGYDGPRESRSKEPQIPTEVISIPYTSGMGGDALAGPGTNIEVPYGVHADTFFLDLEGMEWIRPALAGKPTGYRYGAAAAPSGAQVIIFGGWEAGRSLQDLVVLDMSGLVDMAAGESPEELGSGGRDTAELEDT